MTQEELKKNVPDMIQDAELEQMTSQIQNAPDMIHDAALDKAAEDLKNVAVLDVKD